MAHSIAYLYPLTLILQNKHFSQFLFYFTFLHFPLISVISTNNIEHKKSTFRVDNKCKNKFMYFALRSPTRDVEFFLKHCIAL